MAETETPGIPTGPSPEEQESEWSKWRSTEVPPEEETEEERQGKPVLSFWQRLLKGDPGKSRIKEVGRSIARGAAGFVNETANAIGEGAEKIGLLPETEGDSRLVSKEDINLAYGRRSDDPIAGFAEDATQFAIGFAATAPLGGIGATAGTAGKIAVAAGRGAVVDAVAFDPNEAGLAELVARIPNEQVAALGKALSVNPNDSEAEKRLKRAAAGIVPGVALDALVAGIKYGWAKTAARAGDTPEISKVRQDAANLLAKIASGEHVPDGASVKVKQNPDGTWGLAPTAPEFRMEAEPLGKTPSERFAAAEAGLKFADRAEAEAQASTINMAMGERLQAARNAGGLAPEQAEELRTAFRQMLTDGFDPDGTHFNFSYISEPKDVLAQIEAVSKVFKEELDTAMIKEGVSVEEHAARVKMFLGGLDESQAPGLMKHMLDKGSTIPRSIVLNAADVVLRDISRKVGKYFDVLEARPHDAIAWEEARHAAGQLVDLHEALARENSETGRALKFLQDRDAVAEAAGAVETHPFGTAAKAAGQAAGRLAGATKNQVLAILRMVKMSGGNPAHLPAIAGASKIVWEKGFVRGALELFINSALSSPVTHATALLMNTAVSAYEAGSKMFAGALTANGPMFREGLDILVANEMFLAENFKTASMAFRQGASIINPGEVHLSIPGPIGTAIRTPSRGLLFADEFTRVTNYRSWVYAKSMRYWRDRGLSGRPLAQAVAGDVRNAFDAQTGQAIIPDGMKYAELPTMSADLGRDSFGGKLHSFLNNAVEAKFIAPFVKTSINIFRYTLDRTPGLQFVAKRNREILARGGEEAAVLATQSAMAAGVGIYAYMQAKAGNITGAGPKEPGLRKLWLEDNKPYSVKIDGKWVSYRRLDPLFTPLSIMADVHDMVQELGNEGEADAEDIIAASFAGIAASFANKSYMVGMTSFFEAWSGGEGPKMERWLNQFASTFTTPQLVRSLNDDPYMREVQSFLDQVKSGIPGMSDHLPARYNVFGEPMMRTHSFMPAPVKGSAEKTVATDLLALGRGIMPLNRKTLLGVEVDLTDGSRFGKVDGLTPYEFMQRKLREPGEGEPALKQALTDLVKSDEYKEASPNSEMFPGGERFILANKVIDQYRRRAIAEMLERFPAVEQEVEIMRARKGAARAEGESGDLSVLREYGRTK